MEPCMLTNDVLVYNTSPSTLRLDVEKALKASGLTINYDAKKRTLIKINANYNRNYPGCNTSTWFLDALLNSLVNLGFTDLTVAENDLKLQPAEKTLRDIGIDKVLQKYGIPFLNLGKCPRDEYELPALLHDVQMINVPVIHTHTFAVLSCASKNLFGLLPIYREKYHNELSEKLLELIQYVNPCFTIIDGTVGQEGGSMRMGDPRRIDLILTGWDLLALDTVVAKIMDFSADDIPLLKLAKARGLTRAIAIKGDYTSSLPILNFSYKKSRMASFDLWLRRHFLTKWLFKYNGIPDRLAQYTRKLTLSINYRNKRKQIFDGTWMDYYTNYNADSA